MKLYHNGNLFGSLTNYTYETPWAYADIEPVDPAAFDTLCRAYYFLDVVIEEDWGNLTDQEEDQVYARRLADLKLTEADLNQLRHGDWEIRETERPDRQGKIALTECHTDGWIRWRW